MNAKMCKGGLGLVSALLVLAGTWQVAETAAMNLADTPVLTTAGVPPNFILTLDDSNSMGSVEDVGGVPYVLYRGSNRPSHIDPFLLPYYLGEAPPEDLDSLPYEEQLGFVLYAEDIWEDYDLNYFEEGYVVSYQDVDRALRSSHANSLAYDPTYTYKPPRFPDGTLFPDAKFDEAWDDGFDAWLNDFDAPAVKVNLSNAFIMKLNVNFYKYSEKTPEQMNNPDNIVVLAPERAWYTRYIPDIPGAMESDTEDCVGYLLEDVCHACDGDVYDGDCYIDVTVPADDPVQETNYANWYSYYRYRLLAAKTAITHAFVDLSPSIRLGYQSINAINPGRVQPGTDDPYDEDALHSVAAFTGTSRTDFYQWLAGVVPAGIAEVAYSNGTPLLTGVRNAGEYLTTAAPYRDDPDPDSTLSPNEARSCRQNFQLVFTDGGWQGDNANVVLSSNVDGTAQTFGGSNIANLTDYSPVAPYADGNSGYLADHTFYYWFKDLRADDEAGGEDKVPTDITQIPGDPDPTPNTPGEDYYTFYDPANDPATWQHMVTHTIGFGTQGVLRHPNDLPDLKKGEANGGKDWTDDKIDDLWHAAINSRGGYFSVSDPTKLEEAMKSIVQAVAKTSGSAAALSANSGSVFAHSLLFQATFNSENWTGDVIAYQLATGEEEPGDECFVDDGTGNNEIQAGDICQIRWQAAALLDNSGDRNILTYKPGTGGIGGVWGTNWSWSDLSPLQQFFLNNQDADTDGSTRMAHVIGDQTNEQSTGSLRRRASLLGDIVNSAPLFVGVPNGAYTESAYDSFKSLKQSRVPMVYVGANDGMLHAFDAGTRIDADGEVSFDGDGGKELFAYIPNAVYRNLAAFTKPDWITEHKFLVDGPLNSGDVVIDGNWSTALVGGLGKGGQAVFALDVTLPSSSMETSKVLWEFSDVEEAQLFDSPDMGYSYGRPAIARIASGSGTKWVAVFGNGYNNTADDDVDQDGEDDGGACDDDDETLPCTVSATGDAALYLVDLKRITSFVAADVVKLPIPVGMVEDPTGQGRANGLTSVTLVDEDSDLVADFLYAGDLFGNVWKILLTSSGPAFAFSELVTVTAADGTETTDSVPLPLFSARDGSAGSPTYGTAQPVTSKIRVARHPRGDGLLVLFGTGKYLHSDDVDDKSIQTFYGIWDRSEGDYYGYPDDSTAIRRADLLEQKILAEDTRTDTVDEGSTEVNYRVTTDNRIEWRELGAISGGKLGWYIDLKSPTLDPAIPNDDGARGERVVQEPQLRNNRIVFTSIIPNVNSDPCEPGSATGWVNILDVRDGSRLSESPVDTNLSNSLGYDDLVAYGNPGDPPVAVSSVRIGSDDVVYSVPATMVSGSDLVDYLADSSGEQPVKLLESSGLVGRAWSELR